jgi:hypothetical protein
MTRLKHVLLISGALLVASAIAGVAQPAPRIPAGWAQYLPCAATA